MRLKKKQKEAVLAWIAEGLQSDEINARAATFRPPFSVDRQQVDYYRQTREADILAILRAGEFDALTTGLATRETRVVKLKQLAALMERDLFGGILWTEDVKSVKSGETNILVDIEEFNKAEVDSYRGVLDDIAKEVGQRVQKVEHTINDHAAYIKALSELRDEGKLTPAIALQQFGIDTTEELWPGTKQKVLILQDEPSDATN